MFHDQKWVGKGEVTAIARIRSHSRVGIPFTALALLLAVAPASAQWVQNGPDIVWTPDLVGIGTDSPITQLHVAVDQSGGAFAVGGARIANINAPANGERTVVLSLQNVQAASGQDWLLSNIGNSPGRGGNFEIRQIGPGVSNENRFTITPTGTVGVGTVIPGAQLTITKCLRFDEAGPSDFDVDLCNDDASFGDEGVTLRALSDPAIGAPIFRVLSSGGTAQLQVEHEGRLYTANRLWVAGAGDSHINGSLGIGTTTPQSELAVNGRITAKELVITATGWPDYVFAEDYPLKTLSEVEQAIAEKGHLPGMPSAAEVERDGVAVGDIQKRLLEKVEELTLYMIDLEKRNQALEERLAQLEGSVTVEVKR